MNLPDQITTEFDAKTDGRGQFSRGDLASRLLWRTVGLLTYRLEKGTPAQRKFANEILTTMLDEIQTAPQ